MTQFPGHIDRTLAASKPWWPEAPDTGAVPNIVTIVLDDTGWADFGCFGSEIRTPHIDSLAAGGLRYTNFHVTPICSPTRASLLTGRNHHNVGMRCLADTDTGFPNSRGAVHPDIPLLPDMLREGGFASYLVGKWHLTPAHEITPAGPFDNWPLRRGFDQFYGFLGGCTDQYCPELIDGNATIDPPLKDGYHLTEDLADRAIRYLRDHATFRPGRPLYLNFCPGATHAPIQVDRAWIDPYVDVFAKGWDRTREDRLARQREMGLVPPDTQLVPRNPEVPAWDSLPEDHKRLYTRLQAAFAGFLEHTDAQIGRLLAELKRLGMFENTIILAMTDNGASREGGDDGAVDINSNYSGQPETVAAMLPRLDDIGGPKGPAHYPQGWAMAGNTPFRRYKQYVELGGIRSPLVVSWPEGIGARGEVRDQFLHAIDVVPTLLDASGVHHAALLDGASFRATMDDAASPAPRSRQYWEMFGRRAIFADGWKAVSEHEKGEDYDLDAWRLHDLSSDFSEAVDLSASHPDRLADMVALWWREAEANEVMPLDDRTLVDIINFRQPNGLMARNEIVLQPGQGHIPQPSMITATERNMEITAHFTDTLGRAEGVLLSSGDSMGGYSFFVQDGRICFHHVRMGHRVAMTAPVPAGARRCSVVLHVGGDSVCDAWLFVDRESVARARIPQVGGHLSFWGLDVGRDAGLPVCPDYPAPFAFDAGALDRVVLRFFETLDETMVARTLEMSE